MVYSTIPNKSDKGNYLPQSITGQQIQKGGRAMKVSILVDWKFVVALGAAAMGVIFSLKMDGTSAERFLTHVADCTKDLEAA